MDLESAKPPSHYPVLEVMFVGGFRDGKTFRVRVEPRVIMPVSNGMVYKDGSPMVGQEVYRLEIFRFGNEDVIIYIIDEMSTLTALKRLAKYYHPR